MNKTLPYLTALLIFLASIHSTIHASQLTIKFAYELKSNPPYYFSEESQTDKELPGITIELLSLVAQKLNIKLSFQRMPWARGLKLLKNNKVDGIFHASFKPQRTLLGAYPMREGKVDPSRSIMSQRYILYKPSTSKLRYENGEFHQLDGKLSVILGYSIAHDLIEMGVTLHENVNIMSSMNMLLKNRVKGVVDLENMGDAFLRNNSEKFSNIIKTSPPITEKPYYLMLSHQLLSQHPALAERIWDSIASIKKSAEFAEIIKKYDKLAY